MPDYEAIYHERAREYDRLVAREDYQHNILRALARIRPLAGVDVAEMGTGTGRLSRLIAPFVKSIVAFDGSQAMLDVAAEHLKASPLTDWQLAVGDNRHLPAADNIVDVSIAGWSFGHSTGWHAETWRREIDLAIGQMKRVLRPGGTAMILETLGTGRETPQPPTAALAAYYALLEEEYGFAASWIRTDYRFDSAEEAEALTRFFFDDALADRVARETLVILPECTGIWALTI